MMQFLHSETISAVAFCIVIFLPLAIAWTWHGTIFSKQLLLWQQLFIGILLIAISFRPELVFYNEDGSYLGNSLAGRIGMGLFGMLALGSGIFRWIRRQRGLDWNDDDVPPD